MTERFLHHLRVELPAAEEAAAEARIRLAGKFSRTALRRMSHLGLLIGSTLDGLPLTSEDAVVYASTFAESRALEDFLLSFPAASPLLFQASIHPSGVQQGLIGRQQSIARLWPLAGQARLIEQALQTALLEPAARVALVGGEERGTWLLEHQMASATAFAFAAILTREPVGALGRVTFTPEPSDPGILATGFTDHGPAAPAASNEACPLLENFARALATRQSLRWHGAGGEWRLGWL
jgi:hypothetical protein